MHPSHSPFTSTLLLLAGLVLACTPTTEETASDASETTATTAATGSTGPTTTNTDSTTATGDEDGTTLITGDPEPTTSDSTTTTGPDEATTAFETDPTGMDTDPSDTDTNTDTDTGAEACPPEDPALASIGIKSIPEEFSGGECTVVDASNAGGDVSLDLLCDLEEVSLGLAVPPDFKVDLAGLAQVKVDFGGDNFFEGTSFVVHDLATGDFVLAVYEMNGFSTYPALAPLSLKEVGACGGNACNSISQLEFSHVDGPSLALFPRTRGTLVADGRDYDIAVRSAREGLCEEHDGDYAWIVGASASL